MTAAGQAARAEPDGYTVLFVFGSFEISPTLSKISCDPRRDFSAVTLAVTMPTVLVVNPVVPAQSVQVRIESDHVFGEEPARVCSCARMVALPCSLGRGGGVSKSAKVVLERPTCEPNGSPILHERIAFADTRQRA